jgi:hypothetical protein
MHAQKTRKNAKLREMLLVQQRRPSWRGHYIAGFGKMLRNCVNIAKTTKNLSKEIRDYMIWDIERENSG